MPTDDDAGYALAIVEAICAQIGPGIPGSAAERRRAMAIRDELASHLGPDDVAVEAFTVAPRAWLSSWPVSAVLVLAAALLNVATGRLTGAAAWATAIAGLILAIAAIATVVLVFVLGLELFDRLCPKARSVNVVGRLRPPGSHEVRRLLIVSGHHDSAPENTWLSLLGPGSFVAWAIAVVGLVVVFAMGAIQVTGLLASEPSVVRVGTLGWVLLLCAVAPTVLHGLLFNRGWRHGGTVPGAADNLAASALLAALARFLVRNPAGLPDDAEIRFLSFGSEEAGLRGSRRYVERHLGELTRLHAQVLNLEIIAWPELAILRSDVNGTVAHAAELVERVAAAAERAEVPHAVKRATLGVGTDAAPFSQAGLRATTLLGFKLPEQLVAFYHQRSDRPDVLRPDALANALKLVVEWIRGERAVARGLAARSRAPRRRAPTRPGAKVAVEARAAPSSGDG